MDRITELKKKRAEKWEEARKFLEEHRNSNGTMPYNNQITYERLVLEAVSFNLEIQRLEELNVKSFDVKLES